jgi:hypothetical protein
MELLNVITAFTQELNTFLNNSKVNAEKLMNDTIYSDSYKKELLENFSIESQKELDSIFEEIKQKIHPGESENKSASTDFAEKTYYATIAWQAIQGLDINGMISYFDRSLAEGNAVLSKEIEQLLRNRLDFTGINQLERTKSKYMTDEEKLEFAKRKAALSVLEGIPELHQSAMHVLDGYIHQRNPNRFQLDMGLKSIYHFRAKQTYEDLKRSTMTRL